MRDLPDQREELSKYFTAFKSMLIKNVKEGVNSSPFAVFVTFTPQAQAELGYEKTICLAPVWKNDTERKKVLKTIVALANRYAESLVLCGCSHGIIVNSGEEATYLFASMNMPGFEPWTYAHAYSVIEKEVVFGEEFSTTDGTLTQIQLPGLWSNKTVD